MQSAQSTVGGSSQHSVPAWPEATFYVSQRRRLVYCPIQKVACSSIKLWWAELDETLPEHFLPVDESGQKFIDHRRLNERYRLQHHVQELGRRPLTDDDWFRFVFVRNPWSRLVSAFINKFVYPQPLTPPVFKAVHRRWRRRTLLRVRDAVLSPWSRARAEVEPLRDSIWPALRGRKAWHDEITFRHFVDYVAASGLDDAEVDPHWRPQYRFVGNLRFQFVGRFERLADDVRSLAARLGVQAILPAVNRTCYMPAPSPAAAVADCPLRQLRQFPLMPGYRHFYTRQLRDHVARLYRRDVEQFHYDFDR
jgi:hypothetical protein